MSDMDQYMPPVELNDPMRGVVCGTVVKSKHPDYTEGTIVGGLGLWADYQIGAPPNVNPMGDTGHFRWSMRSARLLLSALLPILD